MNTAVHAIRDAALRTSCGRQQQPTALADTRVLGILECSSGAFAAWKSWRFTFTSHAGALSPDMKRSAGDRAMSTQLFHVLVMGLLNQLP